MSLFGLLVILFFGFLLYVAIILAYPLLRILGGLSQPLSFPFLFRGSLFH